ncbi:hypothetical protein EDS67_09010 [candidate division KSB1 bacterium]|nr:MAG: hypothetical protein EDS67_09010 [candidate division KSB1 bacterium]MBC6949344.1 hypothetical protein [candidate division KSB1 bacterium]MCE7941474.1 hypothetical protein [Chlorobi bacterium CHB1]
MKALAGIRLQMPRLEVVKNSVACQPDHGEAWNLHITDRTFYQPIRSSHEADDVIYIFDCIADRL